MEMPRHHNCQCPAGGLKTEDDAHATGTKRNSTQCCGKSSAGGPDRRVCRRHRGDYGHHQSAPRDFPAAVVILQHRPAWGQSKLTELLAGRTQLPLIDATSGEAMKAGTIYLARPHQHLTISDRGTFRYVDGTRIRHLLSSANPLFDSAAQVFGPKAVAVVLTGSGMDATDGVQAIKAHGGKVIVQDPATAAHYGMPSAAIRTGAVDFVLPIENIASTLIHLTSPAVVMDRNARRSGGG
jgi:two-component system chemotaxis response regulator CheB